MQRLTPLLGRRSRCSRPLLAACTDAPLPTVPQAGGPRTNVQPLGTPWLVVSALDQDLCINIRGAGAEPGEPDKKHGTGAAPSS